MTVTDTLGLLHVSPTHVFYADRQTDRYYEAIIVNDDQKDATILAYLFIPNQLYIFRAMSSPIIMST